MIVTMRVDQEWLLSLAFEALGNLIWKNLKPKNQLKRFRSLYGTSSKVLASIWRDLQTKLDEVNRIAVDEDPLHLLQWVEPWEFAACWIGAWCEENLIVYHTI